MLSQRNCMPSNIPASYYIRFIYFKYAINPHAPNYFYAAFTSYTYSYSVSSVSIGIGVTIPIVIIIVVIFVLVCVLTSRRRRLSRNMYMIPLVNNAVSTSVVVTGSNTQTATAYPMQQSMDQKPQYSNQAPPQNMHAPQPVAPYPTAQYAAPQYHTSHPQQSPAAYTQQPPAPYPRGEQPPAQCPTEQPPPALYICLTEKPLQHI